jgi:hypothetical protein
MQRSTLRRMLCVKHAPLSSRRSHRTLGLPATTAASRAYRSRSLCATSERTQARARARLQGSSMPFVLSLCGDPEGKRHGGPEQSDQAEQSRRGHAEQHIFSHRPVTTQECHGSSFLRSRHRQQRVFCGHAHLRPNRLQSGAFHNMGKQGVRESELVVVPAINRTESPVDHLRE